MRHTAVAFAMVLALVPQAAVACEPTGFQGLTAALVDPSGAVSGSVDATGCNIGVYYGAGASGVVQHADIFGASHYGVAVNGDTGTVRVDILNSTIHDIGDTPHVGNQRGVAIYYRGYFEVSAVTGRLSGNQIWAYQKAGIVTNGPGVQVTVTGNTVTGDGAVSFIAQNGIQIGYGATASVMRNTVSGNAYTGFSTVAGGIIVVGGPGYGTCPDGNPCAYTVNAKINDNVIANNDVGVFLTNLDESFHAPASATAAKAVNNTISNDACSNPLYQAGVSDIGNGDKIIANRISGAGYTSCASGVSVDASTDFTNRPKVHANK